MSVHQGDLIAMKKCYFFALLISLGLQFFTSNLIAQQVSQNNGGVLSSASILQSLRKLQVLGSVLYIAEFNWPRARDRTWDDSNQRIISGQRN